MRLQDSLGIAVLSLGLAVPPATAALAEPPIPREVARGVWLISGAVVPDREPDGNTVVFEASQGLVVVDTGRHEWHRRAILELAAERHEPVRFIINTHWHLDHVSGNPALRAAFPGVRVYASDAIDEALTGFLAASAADAAAYLDDPAIPEDMRADIRADTQTIHDGAALKPDVIIDSARSLTLAGRRFAVHLARDAATGGDVWLVDEQTGIAVLGDLVTLPAPFLDTACPGGWSAALAAVAAVPFRTAIPGHGPPMQPPQFAAYRRSFDSFIACSNSTRNRDACAADWTHGVAALLGGDPRETKRAAATAAYYVDLLRNGGGRSKYCNARSASQRAP